MEPNEKERAKSTNKRTHLTESEIEEILALARRTNLRDWCVVVLAFNHGMRVSEVAGGAPATKDRPAIPPIRLCDIDMKNRTIHIRRLKGSLDTTQSMVDLRGKPALSDVAALKGYLKIRVEDGSGLLFTGNKGPLQRWTLTRMFRSLCQQVSAARVNRGLQPIAEDAMRFHSPKYSIATILANRVQNIFIVKNHLGHAPISSTMQYCHPDQKATAARVKETLACAFATA